MSRRRARTLTDDSAGVDMTPMLDIVFILLIFFIVTATFLDERGLDFTKAQGDGPIGSAPVVSIIVNADNQVAVEGRVVPISMVEPEVQFHLVNKPNAAIVLRADETARLADVVTIKDGMESVGRTVSFETYVGQVKTAQAN